MYVSPLIYVFFLWLSGWSGLWLSRGTLLKLVPGVLVPGMASVLFSDPHQILDAGFGDEGVFHDGLGYRALNKDSVVVGGLSVVFVAPMSSGTVGCLLWI